MPNKSSIVKIIDNLIKNGINFDNRSVHECKLFMKELAVFIKKYTHLSGYYNDNKIELKQYFELHQGL